MIKYTPDGNNIVCDSCEGTGKHTIVAKVIDANGAHDADPATKRLHQRVTLPTLIRTHTRSSTYPPHEPPLQRKERERSALGRDAPMVVNGYTRHPCDIHARRGNQARALRHTVVVIGTGAWLR